MSLPIKRTLQISRYVLILILFGLLTLSSSCSDESGGGSTSGGTTTTVTPPATIAPVVVDISTGHISTVNASYPATCFESMGDTFTCNGPIQVTLSSNPSSDAIKYSIDGDATTDFSSSSPVIISKNNSKLRYWIGTNVPHIANFKFEGLEIKPAAIQSIMENIGYSNTTRKFKIKKKDTRLFDGEQDATSDYNNEYSVRYLEISETMDRTNDFPTVYQDDLTDGASKLYWSSYPDRIPYDGIEEEIAAAAVNNDTKIYHYRYNLRYGEYPSDTSGDLSIDNEQTFVLYIDNDKPKVMAIPPSSGSLDQSITITMLTQDNGYDKISILDKKLGGTLGNATPIVSPTASYCKTSKLPINSEFWEGCQNGNNTTDNTTDNSSDVAEDTYIGLIPTSGDVSIGVTEDTYIALISTDAAGNELSCNWEEYHQYSCVSDPELSVDARWDNSYREFYTPGMLQSRYYHENDPSAFGKHADFGYAIAVGDLNGNNTDDIAIGAPAFSNNDDSSGEANGAVFLWYDGFRERATLSFTVTNPSINVTTGAMMKFEVDGKSEFTVELNPTTNVSPTGYYYARASDYSSPSAATVDEIARVLNRAFMSSFQKPYQAYLYAEKNATTGELSISHINRTIQGYFGYTGSGFSSADPQFNVSKPSVTSYDAVIPGQNGDDEFGFSLAIGPVGSSGTNLLVGAPGYGDNGALYVYQYGSTSQFRRIEGVSNSNGRLGHAVVTYKKNSASFADIYVSAPYYLTSGNANAGAVYKITDTENIFLNTGNNISSDFSTSTKIWGGERDSLFGFSLVVGNYSSSEYLFVGAPGLEGGDNPIEGMVMRFDIRDPLEDQNPRPYKELENSSSIANYYGYSLAIVPQNFDTSQNGLCPCLVVGSPGSGDSESGKAWIISPNYRFSVTGGSNEKLGVSLFADPDGRDGLLFVGARGADNKGHVWTLPSQPLPPLPSGLVYNNKPAIEGTFTGDHLGHSMAGIYIGNTRALITGMPGEYSNGDDTTFYGTGGSNSRIGGVQIYSKSRFPIKQQDED